MGANDCLHACRELMMPMSLGESGRGGPGKKGRTPATPWRRILCHPAVWAILVNNFTFHYAFYVVMNWLPTYFDKVSCPSLTKCHNSKPQATAAVRYDKIFRVRQILSHRRKYLSLLSSRQSTLVPSSAMLDQ